MIFMKFFYTFDRLMKNKSENHKHCSLGDINLVIKKRGNRLFF